MVYGQTSLDLTEAQFEALDQIFTQFRGYRGPITGVHLEITTDQAILTAYTPMGGARMCEMYYVALCGKLVRHSVEYV
jgi:hypothetical protein